MSSRLPAAIGLVTVALVVAGAWLVPWQVLPSGAPPVRPDPRLDFTAAQIAREQAFHSSGRPWSYAALAVGVLVPLVLGLTPYGARLVRASGRLLGGAWWAQVVAGTVVLTLLATLAALPFAAQVERTLRSYGLSTRDWTGWLSDVARGWAVAAVVTVIALLPLVALARRWPRTWWAPAAAGAALLVVAGSLLYPVLVEPVFNTFTPMPPSQLRTSLLDLAKRDGVAVNDVLVADASRRTTATNAYVSGIGGTRRIVVYDTLLERARPREVELVVAHELGHAKAHDVATGTLLGALAGALGVMLLALLLRWQPLLDRAGAPGGAGDPRVIALILALAAVTPYVTAPLSTLVSRRIEARADVHSLVLTHDVAAFIAMQERLAMTNLSDLSPSPLRTALFETHPSTPWRIAMARAWERLP